MTQFVPLPPIARFVFFIVMVFAFSLVAPSAHGAFVPTKNEAITEKTITPQQLQHAYAGIATMSNKEIEKLTGKKLSLKEKVSLFLVRQQLKQGSKKSVESPATWQDKCFTMYLKSGETIEVKIIQIGTNDIKYKRCNKPDDPEMVISKVDVFSIKDSDGESIYSNKNESWKRRSSSMDNQTDGLALAAGITGIGSLTVGLLFAPLALGAGLAAGIMGIVSMRRFRNNPKLRGQGWGITGIVAGGLWVLFIVLLLIALSLAW